MSDKRKYRVYVEFDENYTEVEAKDEDEAETFGYDYFLKHASMQITEIDEIEWYGYNLSRLFERSSWQKERAEHFLL